MYVHPTRGRVTSDDYPVSQASEQPLQDTPFSDQSDDEGIPDLVRMDTPTIVKSFSVILAEDDIESTVYLINKIIENIFTLLYHGIKSALYWVISYTFIMLI